MGKVKLTKKGASRLGKPNLAGQVVEAEVDMWSGSVSDVRAQGKRLTGALTLRSKVPEAQLIQK